jgi:hypothetical protein
VPEWSIGAVLKTAGRLRRPVGSNPTPSVRPQVRASVRLEDGRTSPDGCIKASLLRRMPASSKIATLRGWHPSTRVAYFVSPSQSSWTARARCPRDEALWKHAARPVSLPGTYQAGRVPQPERTQSLLRGRVASGFHRDWRPGTGRLTDPLGLRIAGGIPTKAATLVEDCHALSVAIFGPRGILRASRRDDAWSEEPPAWRWPRSECPSWSEDRRSGRLDSSRPPRDSRTIVSPGT